MNAAQPSPVLTDKELTRIERHIEQDGECILWTGYRDKDGYGYMKWRRRLIGVHRLMYQYHHGPIPPGLEVDHTCHRHNCITPEHLRPRSRKENAADKAESINTIVKRLIEQVAKLETQISQVERALQSRNNGAGPAVVKAKSRV